MAIIRVGLIGLTPAQEFASTRSWTVLGHLPSLLQSPSYEIVALANSSVESAKRSIEAHNLPSTTKAYGSPEDIANDPEVDLIVVSVRVQKHYELIKPALLKNKKVFVEWPLGANLNEVEELTQLANSHGVQNAVGLQARSSPLMQKLKELVTSDRIGRVLSSTVIASSSSFPMEIWPQDAKYYLDMSSGGNEFYIFFGQFLDSFTQILGDLSHVRSILKSQYKTVRIVGTENETIDPEYEKTAPDHIFVQGLLDGGAAASLSFRKPGSTAEETGIRWYISGTKGEILLTGPSWWQMLNKEPVLQVKVGNEPVHVIKFQDEAESAVQTGPAMATNLALLYEAFADGDVSRYATFKSAARTHRLLEKIRQAAVSDL
ncbi:Galactose/lactose metabolism regulatory protein [Trichoderma lentiforme]|uniref:Galactose/lactose metabolism regulatory protein n=1 Tax=Trichoderma lentiforme TaxID=1567552 RepID=A0A9P5C691_9HYPO|nr:Galactose/lactose metabolism regulatory protein [Trichoderma lentiforme]